MLSIPFVMLYFSGYLVVAIATTRQPLKHNITNGKQPSTCCSIACTVAGQMQKVAQQHYWC